MTALAIDSSGNVASVAILDGNELLAEYSINYKKTHSQTLLPMIDQVVKMTEMDLEKLDMIAVSSGPGSFTGLRIGSATAKGLGLALDKPLVAVPTLEGLAYRLKGVKEMVCPMMDARRNQVYTGLYSVSDGLKVVAGQRAVPVEDMLDIVNQQGEETVFLGDGAAAYNRIIKDMVKVPYRFAPANMLLQSAAAVAIRGTELFLQGKTVSSDDFKPEYLRLSQAERERNERLAKEL